MWLPKSFLNYTFVDFCDWLMKRLLKFKLRNIIFSKPNSKYKSLIKKRSKFNVISQQKGNEM